MRLSSHLIAALAVSALAACAGVDGRKTCDATTNEGCLEGYTCDSSSEQCLLTCEAADACLASEYCDIDAGATTGVCRPGAPPGGGDDDGDPGAGD